MRAVMLLSILLAQAPTLDANDPALHNEVFAIGKELRCPVCQGMAIAESPSTMAQDMMRLVKEMLLQGKSREQILDYFTERYGEWVLLRPATHGFSALVWALPPLLLLFAAFIGLRHMARLRGALTPSKTEAPAEVDAYLQAIRDEVKK